VVELTKDNFEEEVLDSSVPVIVDFWASWCMPCKMLMPVIHQLDKEYQGRCKIARLNVDLDVEFATRFHVMNIPTIIFFKDGKEYTRIIGVASKDTIVKKLEEILL